MIGGDLARISIRLALEDLNHGFVHCLDGNRIDELVELFTEDAVYTHGKRRSIGRDAIRRLLEARAARGVRTARHLATGLRVSIDGPTSASGASVCLTFAADAPPPVPCAEPHLVADFIDTYRLCNDGRWRIATRHIERIFVGADNGGPVGGPS